MSEPPTNEDSSTPVNGSLNVRRLPTWAMATVVIICLGLLGVLVLDRVTITSKVLTSPGSTRDITPMLVLDEAMTYRANGEIRMVTVQLSIVGLGSTRSASQGNVDPSGRTMVSVSST